MSFDAGALAHMTYNNPNNGFPATSGLGHAGAGFGNRGSRFNSKRLSVALPPKVNPISEDSVDNPTPRTSRSHLLVGLRTQPKTPAVPASAPYNQTQHNVQGGVSSQWASHHYNGYEQGVPRTAAAGGFGLPQQYGVSAARQNYSLPGQVLAPPTYDPAEDMDPNMVEQLQMTSMFLAQRQQELQQKLAALSMQGQAQAQAQANVYNPYAQATVAPQIMQSAYGQQMQEVQPGVYLVFNPATQSYSYVVNQQQQMQQTMSPSQQTQAAPFSSLQPQYAQAAPRFSVSPPPADKPRSFTPPKKAPSPPNNEPVQPLPPPSATAFRRGHKKAGSSLAINPFAAALEGPKTSTAATFGTQRTVFPPTPMTGTFAPGAARSGEHPMRQPRGPPSLDELTAAPTTKHEGSKNFATRQRRRALDSLISAGSYRRAASGSPRGSPISESDEFGFSIPEEPESIAVSAASSRKMSPIGSEMQQKRGSQGSNDGYFGLSSASSSEGEDGAFKQPPTPATPVGEAPGEGFSGRKKMMLGVLNAAEKRKSGFM